MISHAKFRSAFQSLNGIARKVYDATPISEPWTVAQIVGEMVRAGQQVDARLVHGALAKMAEDSLLREGPKNSYRREEIRSRAVTETTMEIAMTKALPATTPPAAVPADSTALQRLESLEARMGSLAERLQKLTSEFADTAEAVTNCLLDLQEENSTGSEELQKLRQLKTLLKGL